MSAILNKALETHDTLEVGHGTLLLLQKPGKPVGPLTSLRPIVLLTSLRKTLSLAVLGRIQPKVDAFFSVSQSAFRKGRSTGDIAWCHRWLCAMTQCYQRSIHILGLDMSSTFDTIRPDRLISVLSSFLDSDELRMIRLLLARTWLEPRVRGAPSANFSTTLGVPQGDSLSPVLFIVYLEAALRDLRAALPPRPSSDSYLPF